MPAPTKRTWSPVVDQHATWVAVNPVQGCPRQCKYCFLHDYGQCAVPPHVLAGPAETVDLLLSSPWYAPDRAVAFYTWTDVMMSRTGIDHLTELLALLSARKFPNAAVLITKGSISNECLDAIAAARQGGLRLLVQLSYSGLTAAVEPGIAHAALRDNFCRLQERGVPIVHYGRPMLPGAADDIAALFRFVSRYARCSVFAGLKVEGRSRARLATLWPDLADRPEAQAAEGVIPRKAWDFVADPPADLAGYPIFHGASCALACVLEESDRFALFGSPVCLERNRCPQCQRQRCADAAARRPPLQCEAIRQSLRRVTAEQVQVTVDPERREVRLDKPLPTRVVAWLTQEFKARVHSPRDPNDTYWNSGTTGASPLVI